MSNSNTGPLHPAPLDLSSLEWEPNNPLSGVRVPKGIPPVSPNLNWLVELFKEYTIPMMQVFERLRSEGYFPSVSEGRIIRQKLVLAWLLHKDGTKYTAAELIDFVFDDKVYFVGQLVKLGSQYYGTIGDVSWSQDGVFLEGNTVSFKYPSS